MWEIRKKAENFPSTTFAPHFCSLSVCFVRLKCCDAGSVGRSLVVPLDWPMRLSGCVNLPSGEMWPTSGLTNIDFTTFLLLLSPFIWGSPESLRDRGSWRLRGDGLHQPWWRWKLIRMTDRCSVRSWPSVGGRGWLSGSELQITEIFSIPLSAFRALTAQLKTPNAGRRDLLQIKGSEFLNERKWKWKDFIYCQHEELQSCDCYSDAAASDPRVYYQF